MTSQIAEQGRFKLWKKKKFSCRKIKRCGKTCGESRNGIEKTGDRREFLQPVMDNVSKEIKEYGMIKHFCRKLCVERAVLTG